MNLLQEFPFELIHRDGSRHRVPFSRISEGHWVDIWAPRPDFRGAAYQFAIGLLQLAYAPADQEDWQEAWEAPPDPQRLAEAFRPYIAAFELDQDGAAFMQDADLPEAESKGIAGLLIDAPGEKTIRDNLDHFVKRDAVTQMCPHCVAAALFTLQINAPSGGVGHRVSLRGGGPLTTLLVPADPDASLWHRLWLNVLPDDALRYGKINKLSDVLPWMGAPRTSDAKGVGDTPPEAVHRLQAYWSMPRRIRLEFQSVNSAYCDVCGAVANTLARTYRTRNYGVNYTGGWLHPLTPYNFDPKTGPLPLKGQRGGIGYRHWLGLTIGGQQDTGPKPARVVQHFNLNHHQHRLSRPRLWCFGFDMENMKARCWYDSTLPMHAVEPSRQVPYAMAVKALLDVAAETAALLGRSVRNARFSRPQDAPPQPEIPQSFWESTESTFYAAVQQLTQVDPADDSVLAPIYYRWLVSMRAEALRLFDHWARALPSEDANTGRIVEQREALAKSLNGSKPMKSLWQIVNTYRQDKEAA